MVFSSPIFLFGFLPIALLFYHLSPGKIKNIILLSTSLFFYAWGEVFNIGIMIISIFSNYYFGIKIQEYQVNNKIRSANFRFTIGIGINIFLLTSFKYLNFIVDNINILTSPFNLPIIPLKPVHLPLGISFFTFQAISYLVDVYRKDITAEKSLFNLALYISLFPQLIAGPIVRYNHIAMQILDRSHSVTCFASGVKRFIYGLAKKMLIANSLGEVADSVFAFSGNELTLPLAWIGVLAFTIQIYFDFSGYSDMAIGLGKMFGFRINENFNYPYISTSLREFWRRWHISLSTWFKDYIYIPLGGNRVSSVRVYMNLLVVFILTGIWHGAGWTFIIWGVFHGMFLAAERIGLSSILNRMWKPLRHVYTILVVIIGWVFFKADSLAQAIDYLYAMFDVSNYQSTKLQFAQVLSYEALYAFLIGMILSTPVYPLIKQNLSDAAKNNSIKIAWIIHAPRYAVIISILFFSILKISSSAYNPFIYFRF